MAVAVLGFADRLRQAGVDVPTTGVLDAMAALSQIDLASRVETRTALSSTLVKRADDIAAFDVTFERWFAPRRAANVDPTHPGRDDADGGRVARARPGGSRQPPEPEHTTEAAAIREQLAHALATGDFAALPSLAARAVRRWAGLGAAPGTDRYHLHRLLRGLDLSAVGQEALRLDRGGAGRRSALEERLAQGDIEALLEHFRRLLGDEVRARRAAAPQPRPGRGDRGHYARDRVEEVDFLRASTLELREMRAAIRPLARKLAAKMAQQHRRSRSGRLDMRRTLRASLASGGVPLDPALRRRRRTRPELWLLCDVSGSVAEFSRFTLALVYALHEEFAGLRTFVFVDGVDEITDVLDRRVHDVDPYGLLVRASRAQAQRRSDYGRVLRQFLDDYGTQITPRATLIVTGDARTHHQDPDLEALRDICHRSRRVWFLNPEPRERWDRGDSVASLYALACDRMAEVRNLSQLAECVSGLL